MVKIKRVFRVTINGNFKDFNSLESAINFIKKNWDDDTYIADIRHFMPTENILQERRNRNI